MKVEQIVVGPLQENCYLLEKEGEVLIIDPGAEAEKIKEKIGNRTVKKVLITHEHFDHIGALYDIIEEYKVEVFSEKNIEEKSYSVGAFQWEVIATPGHTSDSISYYFPEEKKMFVGDFLFRESIGRCDLPTGDISVMEKSLEKIEKYPDEIKVYPGHGPSTTLGWEKNHNPYWIKKEEKR